MRHLRWPLDGFDQISRLEFGGGHAKKVAPTRYQIRFLRYWFARMLLDEQYKRLGRPLRVLEVGIGHGRMLAFMGGPQLSAERFALPNWIERWDGIDVQVTPETLKRYSYSDYFEADIEQPIDLRGRRYDVIILLHVLEHLYVPELAVQHLAAGLDAGGIVIGGSPTMPDSLAAVHRYWLLHWKFSKVLDDVHAHRHLSVITPGLVRRIARQGNLTVDFLSGTFFTRWSGLFLENYDGWVRANLAWGAVFPALGGEIYFSLRKPI